jgi:hypothetical protein
MRPVQPTVDMQLGNNSTAHNPINESISKSNQNSTLTTPAASKRRASKSTSSNWTGKGTSIRTLLADTRRKRQSSLAAGAPTPPLTQAYCDNLLAECVSHDEWDLVLDVIDRKHTRTSPPWKRNALSALDKESHTSAQQQLKPVELGTLPNAAITAIAKS